MKKLLYIFICALGIICHIRTVNAEEYKILALRVDFPYEDPDHETTSGRGVFEQKDYYSDPDVRMGYTHPWDIPPHNKKYFENHLEALKNYWLDVSESKVNISYEVWPKKPEQAYTMTKKFYKYGNGRSKEQTFQKLVDLFKEAVETCKSIEGNTVDFSKFNTFLIFHAGIGSETSGGLNDIPSAFISNEDFLTYSGTPLVIDGYTIDNGIVVPEMASSYGNVGINGIMAQMFGFRLGLPSFSNNEDGLPSAGGWSLMDTGAMAWGYRTLGFIPTHPCIWSKIELGWIEPVVVTSDTTFDIAATHIDNGLPRGLKIPISDDEYLLIENRFNYAPRDSLPESITFSDSDTSGVWIKVDHYDAYIPGNGILIWHVNDRIIRENRADHTINDDPYRRGLDLLEADGRQDIGAYFSFGDARAEYSIGHEDDTYKLNGVNVLSPLTNPDSGSMWGAESGITVTVNSDPGEVMNISISFRGMLKGFPLSIGAQDNITAVDMNEDGIDELIVSGKESTNVFGTDGVSVGTIYSSNHPSSVYIDETNSYNLFNTSSSPNSDYFLYQMKDGDIIPYSGVAVDAADGYFIFEGNTITTETTEGNITLYAYRYIHYTGKMISSNITSILINNFDHYKSVSLPDSTQIISMAAANEYVAALGDNNILYLGYLDDETLSSYPLDTDETYGPLILDIDRDESYETVVTTGSEILIYKQDGTYESAYLPDDPVGSPVAADIDADGYPEIIQCTEKQIFAFRKNGIIADNFPFNLPPGDENEKITSPPVIVDMDNDGRLDVVCATSNMRIMSFDPEGILTPGFPLAAIGEITSSPCIFKISDSDEIGIAYITTDGRLMAHDLMTTVDNDMYAWPMWKGGPELTSAYLNKKIPFPAASSGDFEAFCYPNPITGSTGTFRIIPSGPTDCTISVYTVDGRKVFERYVSLDDIIPFVPNEIRMNSSGLESGLYIAQIKTRQETILYKLGVLK